MMKDYLKNHNVQRQPAKNAISGNNGHHEKVDRPSAGLGCNHSQLEIYFGNAWLAINKTGPNKLVLLTCKKFAL